MVLQLGVKRLSEIRFLKTNHLRSFEPEKLLQFFRRVELNNRIVGKIRQDLGAAFFREVASDQQEVQPAFAALERIASDEQNAGPQDEREQPLDWLGWIRVFRGFCRHANKLSTVNPFGKLRSLEGRLKNCRRRRKESRFFQNCQVRDSSRRLLQSLRFLDPS